MRARTLLVVSALCAVQGCAPRQPAPPHQWSKPDASYDDFLKDRYACIQDARSRSSGAVVQGTVGAASSEDVLRADIFVPCMAAHGWREDPTGFAPPPGGTVRMR
jgi:hypothetical protein